MRSMRKAVSLLLTAALILTTLNSAGIIQAAKKKKANAKVSFVKITNTGRKLRIEKGKKFRLKTSVKVKPNQGKYKKLKFSSSNRKIVLVNSRGLLKGIKVGTAKITAASKMNPKKKASISVTVTKDVLVNSIKLNKKKITVDEFNEEEIPLKVTKILPANAKNKKVQWSTSDEDVADVNDEGVVTTGDVGVATITATAADKSGAFATCRVIVTENESQGDDDDDGEETTPSVIVTPEASRQDQNSPEPEEGGSSEPGKVTEEPGTEKPGKETEKPGGVTSEPVTEKPGEVTEEPVTEKPEKVTERPGGVTCGPVTEKPGEVTKEPVTEKPKDRTEKPTQKPRWTPDPDKRKKVKNITLTYGNGEGFRFEKATMIKFEDADNYPAEGIDVRYYDKVIVKFTSDEEITAGDEGWGGKATLSSTDDGLGHTAGLYCRYLDHLPFENGTYNVEYNIKETEENGGLFDGYDFEEVGLIDCISVQLESNTHPYLDDEYGIQKGVNFRLMSIEFIAWDVQIDPEDYEYFNDYTLGWSNGIVAYKDGGKKSLDDVGADVYNNDTDQIFGQHFNNNKWDDAKLILTPPLQYTTEDGVAHNVNSALTNWNLCADPGAIDNSDIDGKLYVYGTTEEVEYDVIGVIKQNLNNNHSLTIMSTKDMVNWTDEGTIDNRNLANDPSYIEAKTNCGWGSKAWGPSGLKIDGDGDGEEEYYIFYSNGAAVGYVQGDSPTGPWKDDLGKVLFDQSTPNCKGVRWCFDPAVLVDDKGDAYVYFGGGAWMDGKETETHPDGIAHPKTGRVCKIKFEEGTGKVLLDGEPQEMDAYYMFENSEINQFNGKYFYSYSTNFSVPGSVKAPGALAPIGSGQIACFVSKDPMNITFNPEEQESTEDLKYLGAIIDNLSSIYGERYNNHHHMQSFKGHEYIFYHTTVLGNSLYRDSKGYRNLHVDEIAVDEKTDAISIKPSYEGASQIEDFEPYKNEDGSAKYINATTSASSAGVKSSRDDVMVSGSINGSPMVLDEIDTGDWSCIRGVDFGELGLKNFGVEYLSNSNVGRIELFIDSPTKAENQVAAIGISGRTNGKYVYRSVPITETVTGKHDVYFVFRGSDYKVASWSFAEMAEAAGPDISGRPEIPTPKPTLKPTKRPTPTPPTWTFAPDVTPDPYVPEGEGWIKLDLSTWSGDADHFSEKGNQIYLDDVELETIPLPETLEYVGEKIEILVRGSLSTASSGFRFWLANNSYATITQQFYYTEEAVGISADAGNADQFLVGRPFHIQTTLEHINKDEAYDQIATYLLLKGPSFGTYMEGVTITGIWVRYGEAIGS